MWNKKLKNTDRHEERQKDRQTGGERDNGVKERSYKSRHGDGQIYR